MKAPAQALWQTATSALKARSLLEGRRRAARQLAKKLARAFPQPERLRAKARAFPEAQRHRAEARQTVPQLKQQRARQARAAAELVKSPLESRSLLEACRWAARQLAKKRARAFPQTERLQAKARAFLELQRHRARAWASPERQRHRARARQAVPQLKRQG
ncbi:MAG TPA: hypothetical protein PK157_14060, partial [Bryobacteraceae bacterium]|nr:hypothetical protein [Bryobacteraceae bacterium]